MRLLPNDRSLDPLEIIAIDRRPLLADSWRDDLIWQTPLRRRPHQLAYQPLDDGCIVWTGVSQNGHSPRAYRRIYQHFYGLVSSDQELHHLCGRGSCCNPTHMVAVSRSEHREITRGAKKGRLYSLEHAIRVHQLAQEGLTHLAIARDIGMSRSHVTLILLGARWPEAKPMTQSEKRDTLAHAA